MNFYQNNIMLTKPRSLVENEVKNLLFFSFFKKFVKKKHGRKRRLDTPKRMIERREREEREKERERERCKGYREREIEREKIERKRIFLLQFLVKYPKRRSGKQG